MKDDLSLPQARPPNHYSFAGFFSLETLGRHQKDEVGAGGVNPSAFLRCVG